MAAALPIIVSVIALVALLVAVEGAVRGRRLRRRAEQAWHEVPRDPATGLLDDRVCLQRVAAELKRARRGGGNVWIGIITVLDGDVDRFGRLLHDSMRVPEVGFRLDDHAVCIARPDMSEALRDELLGRVAAAAPRERLAIGEQLWRSSSDGDAAQLLERAHGASIEMVPS